MPIHIYNSLTRKKEEFIPLNPQEVKMYACGPTVYDAPHIGHARSAYIFDVIRRYLAYKGYPVKFVRNVTDVDDKIINKAKEEFPGEDLNSSFKKVADKYLLAYHEALKSLGIGEAGILEPKASEYIPKMIKFIQGLIDKGAAYASGGDVYFDITKAKNYGKLSNQSLDKLESGAKVVGSENKRDPLDFALWKTAKEGEPSWMSPWGKGRPGWHIECSVMSSDILGSEFDIHGGGIDLIFPHHENEIAQSEAAGEKFARYWIHHGLLTINGQKMSKSLGNFITVQEFLDKYNYPDLLKLLFLSTHYSHPVDFNEQKIKEEEQVLERIMILWDKLSLLPIKKPAGKVPKELQNIKNKFIEAMDDDFNTPQALVTIFDLVNITNKNIENLDFIYHAKESMKELAGILGISCERKYLEINVYENISVKSAIELRLKARENHDYAEADRIRKELEAKGIILEDTKDGTTWRRKL
jgi:cysteinyl-tRNA synthetase